MITNGKLTPRRQALLDLLRVHAAKPIAALGLRDIMNEVGFTSTSVASANLKALEDAGYVRLHQMKARRIELVQHGPTPAQQVQSLRAVIDEAAQDLDRWAGQMKRRDPHMAQSLAAIAEGLRAGAAEATGEGA